MFISWISIAKLKASTQKYGDDDDVDTEWEHRAQGIVQGSHLKTVKL